MLTRKATHSLMDGIVTGIIEGRDRMEGSARSGRFGGRTTVSEGRTTVGLRWDFADGSTGAHDGGEFVEAREVGAAGGLLLGRAHAQMIGGGVERAVDGWMFGVCEAG